MTVFKERKAEILCHSTEINAGIVNSHASQQRTLQTPGPDLPAPMIVLPQESARRRCDAAVVVSGDVDTRCIRRYRIAVITHRRAGDESKLPGPGFITRGIVEADKYVVICSSLLAG